MNRAVTAAVVAGIAGLGAAACQAPQQGSSAAAGRTASPSTSTSTSTSASATASASASAGIATPSTNTSTAATVAPVGPWATEIYPSAPATLPPSEQGCAPKPLIKDVRVMSVTQNAGTLEINAYVESVACGPGVPDDVEFTDTGAVQSFPAAATAAYTLRGSDPTRDYAVSADAFMAVYDGQGNVDGKLGVWGRICVLHLDQKGRVVSADGVYIP